MCAYLRTIFQVSSIIVTRFRQGEKGFYPLLPPPQNEPLKSPPRLGLNETIQHNFSLAKTLHIPIELEK